MAADSKNPFTFDVRCFYRPPDRGGIRQPYREIRPDEYDDALEAVYYGGFGGAVTWVRPKQIHYFPHLKAFYPSSA